MIRTAATAMVVMWAASAAHAGEPIPSGPEAGTAKAYHQALYDDVLARTVEAYMRTGHRSDAWDADALALLSGAARWMSGHPAVPRHWDLVMAGWEARDAGCRDPMIEFCYGYMLAQWDHADAVRPLRIAAGGMRVRDYTHLDRALAAATLTSSARSKAPELDRSPAWNVATQEAVEAIEAGELDDMPVRAAARWLSIIIGSDDAPPTHAQRVLEAVEAREALAADPWLLHMLRGDTAIAAGFRARGTGWADSVTDEGWAELDRRMKEAGEHYLRAWEADPTRPEAAASMIQVCKVGEPPDERTARDWFDAAVALEMNYAGAYGQYLDYLHPKWAGGLAEMIAFGKECAATKRYDTIVPYYFITGVSRAAADTIGLDQVWRDPDLYDLAMETLEGLASSPTFAVDPGRFISARAGIAWASGDVEEASRLMRTIDDKIDKRTLWVMRVEWKRMVADVERARTHTPY